MMVQTNVKTNKYCAFCKYWYDPELAKEKRREPDY